MTERINLSMKEAAHRLGVSKAYLYLELSRGNLPSLQFGKRRLVAIADLDAYQGGASARGEGCVNTESREIEAAPASPADREIALALSVGHARHQLEFETTRAEQKRLEAAAWKEQFGQEAGLGAPPYSHIRGTYNLEGMLADIKHRLGGEISSGPDTVGSPQITQYKRQIRELQTELSWRRANPDKDPKTRELLVDDTEPPDRIARPPNRTRRLSPGRPRKMSGLPVPMRMPRLAEEEAA